jgi:hypothetical protein
VYLVEVTNLRVHVRKIYCSNRSEIHVTLEDLAQVVETMICGLHKLVELK